MLFCCENNLYAMGTALERSVADRPGAAGRQLRYAGLAGRRDGRARRRARRAQRGRGHREGGGPHFLELRTYRFRAHSMYDPDLYRDKAEVEEWKKRDPIDR